jgi:hypothetical protein
MSESITLDIPDELAQRARAVAEQTHRRLEDVLIDWLGRAASDTPVTALPDDELLALADTHMSDPEQEALSDLLARQREGTLDAAGQARLESLMTAYRRGLVRKAEALKVAVQRGLPPR